MLSAYKKITERIATTSACGRVFRRLILARFWVATQCFSEILSLNYGPGSTQLLGIGRRPLHIVWTIRCPITSRRHLEEDQWGSQANELVS